MRSNHRYAVPVFILALLVLTACGAPAATKAPVEQPVAVVSSPEQPPSVPPTLTAPPTKTPRPTATKIPTLTPRPTATRTATATPDPTLLKPGTYLVGVDIQPGLYIGQAGTGFLDSCYWERKKDLSGDVFSIIANDNATGQFYVEIEPTDFAFEVACSMHWLPTLPAPATEFPTRLMPGTYLVGIDIRPGLYRGQAGQQPLDSCYWERLRDVKGDLYSIITNDNANGQYFIQVSPTDFALSVACEVEFVK